jgi:hypothetical protein
MTSDDVRHSLLDPLLHHLLCVLLQLGEDQASPGPPVHQFVLRATQRGEARVYTRKGVEVKWGGDSIFTAILHSYMHKQENIGKRKLLETKI